MTPFVDDFNEMKLLSTVKKIKDDFEIGLTSKKNMIDDNL